jgi:hypothetical protein
MAESEDNKPVTMKSCLEQETGNLKAFLKR